MTVLDIEGPAAPPRQNGELVFAEPWESRAFGLALTLHASGAFEWETFRQELVATIARWEASGEPWSYYACWLTALERVVVDAGLIQQADLEGRGAELAARPAGHDHGDHDHGDHDHGDHDHGEHDHG
jgi:nitrile hydratase accessory protein